MQYAKLRWKNGLPISTDYDDIYYDQQDAIAESEYVFLYHNQLPQRWQNNSHFTIGEMGFGSGLRFLTTWQCWQQQQLDNSHLYFISAEKHPLSVKDLQQAHQTWPSLKTLSQRLCQCYPIALPGQHYLRLTKDVTLILLFGEASEQWQQVQATVNAWFLDGFSPKQNPEMWSEKLFSIMAAHSITDSTFATYSAASLVNERLTQAGFQVNKAKGVAKKRHLLVWSVH